MSDDKLDRLQSALVDASNALNDLFDARGSCSQMLVMDRQIDNALRWVQAQMAFAMMREREEDQ